MKLNVMILLFITLVPHESKSQNREHIDSLKERLAGYQHVSMISLISNPMKYHGKRIHIEGYLHLKFEDAALYLCKKDADYLIGANAYWVRFSKKVKKDNLNKDSTVDLVYFDSKYVAISGVFNYNNSGHLGSYAGAIESIDHISELRQWYDGDKELWEDKLDGNGLIRKN